jgi:hydrogenase maturation protease
VRSVLIGVGNPFRRDDGIGPAIAELIAGCGLPGVATLSCDGDPSLLIEAWTGASLAVIVDAMTCDEPVPGRLHRSDQPATWAAAGPASTHGLGIADAVRLGAALRRMPGRLVLFAAEAGDRGFGPGLSGPAAAALPDLARAVLAELRQA